MNYLNYKKQFPKSIKLFFDWVSTRQADESVYVDNIYFKFFFSKYFDYREYNQYTPYNSLFIDTDKEYFQQLKSDLILSRDNGKYNHLFDNNKIIFGNYTNTNEEYIRIIINSESSFESAFFVLESLIENSYYGSK